MVALAPVDWEQSDAVTVKVYSTLEEGDLGRVKDAFAEARDADRRVLALEMASDGGDADTGLALAEYVAANDIEVLLRQRCWSACSFVALVALGRGNLTIREHAEIGVHQARDTYRGTASPDWTRDAAKRLKRLGAPAGPLKEMVETPPSSMSIYGYYQLQMMGATAMPGSWWVFWE